MFKWLPVYNFLVIFATVAYQAPFERLFGRYLDPDDKVCCCSSCMELLSMSALQPSMMCVDDWHRPKKGHSTESLAAVSFKLHFPTP